MEKPKEMFAIEELNGNKQIVLVAVAVEQAAKRGLVG